MIRCPVTNRIRGTLSLFGPRPVRLTDYQLRTLARVTKDYWAMHPQG